MLIKHAWMIVRNAGPGREKKVDRMIVNDCAGASRAQRCTRMTLNDWMTGHVAEPMQQEWAVVVHGDESHCEVVQ